MQKSISQGPVVQSVVSLTSSFRVISLTVLADSIHNILICISLDVNFNESLTNDVVRFEQLGLGLCSSVIHFVIFKELVLGQ